MASRNKRKDPKLVAEWKCKKCKKSTNMWIEQILLKINTINKRLDELQETAIYISDFLDIKDKADKK
jgi:transcription elongation factor Elf1